LNHPDSYRSGFVALIGAPNTGKSTLLNRILGQKVSITSSRPQTTRNRIVGVKHLPNGQIVFLDTPGIHRARSKLNRRLVQIAQSTLEEVNLIVWVVDAQAGWGPSEELIGESLEKIRPPMLLAVNKVDLLRRKKVADMLQWIESLGRFHDVLAVSALQGQGVDALVARIEALLPPGPPYFPADMITDLPERFLAAEWIREKAMRLCFQEVPYAVAVTVESFEEKEEQDLVVIHATIHVERKSQKGILIGEHGAMLKRIGTAARKDLEVLLGSRVYLELWVRVQKNWREQDRMLREFGY